jgi:hypothetical protein
VFALLAEHREALFPAGMFADMYPSPNGRPGLPPQVLAVTVVRQTLHGLSTSRRSRSCGVICGGRPRVGWGCWVARSIRRC